VTTLNGIQAFSSLPDELPDPATFFTPRLCTSFTL
jgi:hypothetical protein